MTKRERILGVALLVALATLLIVQLANPCYLRAKYKAQPQLYILPQVLQFESIAPCKTNLSVSGYSIGVPWENCIHVYNTTNKAVGGGAYIFGNGRKFIVFIHPIRGNSNPYHTYQKIHTASPHDFRAFQSQNVAEKIIDLLMRKSVIGIFPYSSTYEFKTQVFNGFQIGNPKIDSHVEIDAFDHEGNLVHFTMAVGKTNENPLTQDHINCILQSLKKEK